NVTAQLKITMLYKNHFIWSKNVILVNFLSIFAKNALSDPFKGQSVLCNNSFIALPSVIVLYNIAFGAKI
ncbi:hypothetical protein, partial [Acinetobacter baumannii]|uniref:hypothetical protein n=1 Tax=Acinetobacter baumannii TaxID=470 RepID=UPI001C07DDC0